MIDYEPIISAAVEKRLNVIASSNDEYDFGADLLKSLQAAPTRVTHLDLKKFKVIDLFTHPVNDEEASALFPSYILEAEVIFFSSMEFVDAEMMDAIAALMENRTLRGVALSNLKSVIVSYDFQDEPEEIIRLQRLAPALTIAFS